jgi:hypothetical protein
MSWTPSALPAAPLQVPSAVITVADIPPPSAISSRADWKSAAVASVTGSSLIAANAAVGKGAIGTVDVSDTGGATVVDGGGATVDATGAVVSVPLGVELHATNASTKANIKTRPGCVLISSPFFVRYGWWRVVAVRSVELRWSPTTRDPAL